MSRHGSKAPAPAEPFHAPFARWAHRSDIVPAPARPPPDRTSPERPPPARAVIRLERKGRGGKEATVIEKLALGPAEADRWLGELKQALGCGGAVEGDALVLQGDQRQRLRSFLAARGVAKITVG